MKKRLLTSVATLAIMVCMSMGFTLTADAGLIQDAYGTCYVDDPTGIQAFNSWVPIGDKMYFFDNSGYLLTSHWVIDVDGSLYLLSNEGYRYTNCDVQVGEGGYCYDISTVTQYANPYPAGIYSFGPDGKAVTTSNQPSNDGSTSLNNSKMSQDEMISMASQYLPYDVYSATPTLVFPTFAGYYVEFATEKGNFGVWMEANIYGALLFGQDMKQFVCTKACYV